MERILQMALAFLGLIVVLAVPTDAFAYIDAGTGAYVLQVGASVVGTIVFYLSRPQRLLGEIKAMFRSWRSRHTEE